MVTFHLAPFKSQSSAARTVQFPQRRTRASRPTCSSRCDRASGRGTARAARGRAAPRGSRPAASRSGPRCRPRASWPRELGVARSVVVDAYGQLAAEGYLEARQGSGTRVRATHRDGLVAATAARGAAARPRARGCSAASPTPRASRARSGSATTAPRSPRSRPPPSVPRPAGRRTLRDALAAYLGRVRAVVTTPEHVQVCGGFTQGLALVCRALRAQGARRLAVEDPCFSYHRELIANAGLEPVPVPSTPRHRRRRARGRRRRRGRARRAGPLLPDRRGAGAAAPRRARRVGARDGRARSSRTTTTRSSATTARRSARCRGCARIASCTAGASSKTLSPILRVGWLAAPEWLMADLRREKLYDDLATGTLDQLALARPSSRAATSPGICAACGPSTGAAATPRSRALAEHVPDATPVGVAAGLHLYVHLPDDCDERALVHAARRARRPAGGRRPPLGRLRRRAARARHRLRDGGRAGDRAGDPGARDGVRDHRPGRSGDERRRLKIAPCRERGRDARDARATVRARGTARRRARRRRLAADDRADAAHRDHHPGRLAGCSASPSAGADAIAVTAGTTSSSAPTVLAAWSRSRCTSSSSVTMPMPQAIQPSESTSCARDVEAPAEDGHGRQDERGAGHVLHRRGRPAGRRRPPSASAGRCRPRARACRAASGRRRRRRARCRAPARG